MPEPISVSFTAEFRRNVRCLARKHRNIRRDLQPVVEQLGRGETPGDQIQQTGHTVYKVRAKNTNAQRGKSGGYRVIYYLRTANEVVLITVYSKTEQGDISAGRIRRIIDEQ